MNSNYLCVLDFETGGKNPRTCTPLSLAAAILDPRKLEICDEFSTFMKPATQEEWDGLEQEALDICKLTKEYLSGEAIPERKHAWKEFYSFIKKYIKGKAPWSCPILCGHNILGYDKIILERLCQEAKQEYPFHPRDAFDTMHMVGWWFENSSELRGYSLVALREYLGMSKDSLASAHTAIGDVRDCAAILVRFLKMHRRLYPNVKFKGAFARQIEGRAHEN
jgi:DNA polymerase III epsilon subunit-like protein